MKYLLSTLTMIMAFGMLTVAMPETAFAGGSAKVDVCHIPPGNPENFHTIRISEKALNTHMAHGDFAGACNARCAELCNDGNACTVDDVGDCDHGCPAPDPVDCDDSSLCTNDSCDPASGCINAPTCTDDGDLCTVDACEPSTGACSAPPVACDAGSECNPATGGCESQLLECKCWDIYTSTELVDIINNLVPTTPDCQINNPGTTSIVDLSDYVPRLQASNDGGLGDTCVMQLGLAVTPIHRLTAEEAEVCSAELGAIVPRITWCP